MRGYRKPYDTDSLLRLKSRYNATKNRIAFELQHTFDTELHKQLMKECPEFENLMQIAHDVAVELYCTTNPYTKDIAFDRHSWMFDIDIRPDTDQVVVNLTDKYCNAHSNGTFPIRLLYLHYTDHMSISQIVDTYRQERAEVYEEKMKKSRELAEQREYEEYLRLKAKYEK